MTQPIRVLHVDDDAEFVETAGTFFEAEDDAFDVVTATSAGEGLDAVAAEAVDCIVSDYRMPGTDGLEFLEAVRETRPDVPFVLFTGQGSEAVASDAIAAGATDYLQKQTGTEQYELLANRVRNAVESRRRERELERSRERLRTIVDLVPHPLYVVDEDGTYLLANEALAALHDTSVDAVEGTHVSDVLAPAEYEQFEADAASVLESGEGLRIDRVTVADAAGRERVFEPRLLPFEFEGERGVLGVAVDITAQDERRQEVERVRTELRTLIDTVPAAVYVEDFAERFRMLNDYAKRVFAGADAEESFDGARIDEVFPPDVAANLVERNRAVVEAGEPVDGEEVWLPATDGERVFRRYAAPVPGESGEPDAVCGVSVDVTDEYERRRELERQNERLDGFASIISHDLRNPLTVARGRVEVASETCESDHLDVAVDALDRMERIVEDTLVLAREGEAVGETEPVSLAALADDCWGNLDTSGASVTVVDPPRVRADPDRLAHVLENLYRNAVEHGGEGVQVEVGALADDAGFYVADDGSGIPEEDRPHVFEPGYTTVDGGTGFGLSIVAEVVEAHGWTVDIAEEEGTRVEVRSVETVN